MDEVIEDGVGVGWIIALARRCERDRLEAACARAPAINAINLLGERHPQIGLVVHHSDFDVLIPSHSRMSKFSGGKRISMLLGTPG
ncbi:hypothetical protein ACF1BQ_030700 [Bradyrhizobium sp. RDT10]